MSDHNTDASIAFGTASIELLDKMEFREMAQNFAQGRDPGNADITLLVSGTLESGWHLYATRIARIGIQKFLLRRPLSDLVFAHNETKELHKHRSDKEYSGLSNPIINSAEYIIVAVDGDTVTVCQATCIVDEDTAEEGGNIWNSLDPRLVNAIPTP